MRRINPIRIYGMTEQMAQAYRRACIKTFGADSSGQPKFVPRLVQGRGNAKASAGTHGWECKDSGQLYYIKGMPYCCAIDISIKGWWGITGLQDEAIKWFLYNLALEGFVGWYRYRRSFARNRHIHAIYVKHPRKPALDKQVRDWLANQDGLAGHEREVFWTAPKTLQDRIERDCVW